MNYGMHTTPKIILACVLVTAAATAVGIPFLGMWAIFIAMTAFGFLVIIGTPIFLILRAKHMLEGFTVALAGFLGGSIPTVIWVLVRPHYGASPFEGLELALFLGVIGIPCALLYGGIWNLLSAKQDRFPWSGSAVHRPEDEKA
jgi:hypothetical protein